MIVQETAKAIIIHLTGRPDDPTPMLIEILNNFVTSTCPFCGESDFDLIGLKNHIKNGWCDGLIP